MNFTRQEITIRTATPPEKQEGFLREQVVNAMVAEGTDLAYYQPPLATVLGLTLRQRHIFAYQICTTNGEVVVGNPLPTDETTAQECIRFLVTHHQQVTQSEIERYAAQHSQWYHLEPPTDEERAALVERKPTNEALAELQTMGYRDITELVRPYYQDEASLYEELYLCTLQQPSGEPLYCRTPQELFAVVEAARLKDEPQIAREPSQAILQTLVGDLSPREDNDRGR